MANFNDYELFVITSWATYVGLSMYDSTVYTDETEALVALDEVLKTEFRNVNAGFKYRVEKLSDFISEYAREQYHRGQYPD